VAAIDGPAGVPRARETVRVAGVDGGGSRLRVVLADGEGRILRRWQGRAVALAANTVDEVARSIQDGLGRLFVSDPGKLDALCAGMAGAGRREVAEGLEARMRSRGLARRIRVTTDAEVALSDAFPRDRGVLLIAGTGSIALIRDPTGAVRRVGGWGPVLGDEGSAYTLARRGLAAALRGVEGRGPRTRLSESLPSAAGVDGPRALAAWATEAGRADVAALAPRVVAAAEGDDPVARRLVDHAVNELVAHVVALAPAEGAPDRPLPPVALAGGLLEEGRPLRRWVEKALLHRGYPVLDRPVRPVRGAVRGALDLLEPDPSLG
jgi:N-acetylglucosamine kinase-like BadF-type ATPase